MGYANATPCPTAPAGVISPFVAATAARFQSGVFGFRQVSEPKQPYEPFELNNWTAGFGGVSLLVRALKATAILD